MFNPAAVPGFKIQGVKEVSTVRVLGTRRACLSRVPLELTNSVHTQASPFHLSSPFTSVVSPSQTSAVPPSPAPATAARSSSPSPASPASSAASHISDKVSHIVADAKSKASDVAAAAQQKASEVREVIGDEVGKAERKAEGKVDALKDDKKWV